MDAIRFKNDIFLDRAIRSQRPGYAMHRPKYSERRIGFERLDERTVLNGTVTASLGTGAGFVHLRLAGDAAANNIVVHQTGSTAGGGANIQVIGIGTKIAVIGGSTGNSATFPGVTEIEIEMGNGSDILTFSNTTVIGGIFITMGDGNDVLVMSNVKALGLTGSYGIDIDMGNGNNVASLFKVSATTTEGSFGGLRLVGGIGRDIVTLNSVATSDHGDGDLFVDLFPGNHDMLTVVNCSGGSAALEDEGTNAILIGTDNHFAAQDILGYTIRLGDLKHSKL